MEWFSQNWVWVLFFIGFIAMHLFGHGGHGGYGGSHNESMSANKNDMQTPSEKATGHKH